MNMGIVLSPNSHYGKGADVFAQEIVSQWPEKMLTDKALQLDFHQDISISDIVNQYIEEENVVINKGELA
jgi:hypothetical protein